MHRWSDDDNLIAYCLYRFGGDVFGSNKHVLGDMLGMGHNSIALKIANFKCIDGQGGLDQYSQQALRIFTKYCDLPSDEVRVAGNAALQRATDGTSVPYNHIKSSLSQADAEIKIARLQRQMEQLQAQMDKRRVQ